MFGGLWAYGGWWVLFVAVWVLFGCVCGCVVRPHSGVGRTERLGRPPDGLRVGGLGCFYSGALGGLGGLCRRGRRSISGDPYVQTVIVNLQATNEKQRLIQGITKGRTDLREGTNQRDRSRYGHKRQRRRANDRR